MLALEIDLIAHDGVEVLVRRVHGLESARLKSQRSSGARRASRDVEPVLSAFDDAFAPEVRVRIQDFLDDLSWAAGYLQRRTGANLSLSGVLRTPNGVRSLWSLTLDEGPFGGPQFFLNVNTWVEAFGQEQVDAMLDAFAEVPELAPVAQSVRSRCVEKLHRIRITDAFGSDATSEHVRTAMRAIIDRTGSD